MGDCKHFSRKAITFSLLSLPQVLHVIDDILEPLTFSPSSTTDLKNLDAFQFISYSDSLDIGDFRIRFANVFHKLLQYCYEFAIFLMMITIRLLDVRICGTAYTKSCAVFRAQNKKKSNTRIIDEK